MVRASKLLKTMLVFTVFCLFSKFDKAFARDETNMQSTRRRFGLRFLPSRVNVDAVAGDSTSCAEVFGLDACESSNQKTHVTFYV
jgi:hypothetical protein